MHSSSTVTATGAGERGVGSSSRAPRLWSAGRSDWPFLADLLAKPSNRASILRGGERQRVNVWGTEVEMGRLRDEARGERGITRPGEGMQAFTRGMRGALTSSSIAPGIKRHLFVDHRPTAASDCSKGGAAHTVSWGWLIDGGGGGNCTGGIGGLSRCAGATGGGTARLLWAQRRRSSRVSTMATHP